MTNLLRHHTTQRHTARTAAALVALGVLASGCAITSVTTVGGDANIVRTRLAQDVVRGLRIGQLGTGPVTWARLPGELAPGDPMTVIVPFRAPTDGIVEVLHRDADTKDGAEVTVRPAWSTRLDNRDSGAPMRTSVSDEVTISYVQPSSPGQLGEGGDYPALDIDVSVDIAPGDCTDVVALQVWQLDEPAVDGTGATVDATYLGSQVVSMPCQSDV